MEDRKKTTSEVAHEVGVSVLTLKKWEKERLITIKKSYSERYKEPIRYYTEEDVRLLRWIKYMSGGNRSNYGYLRLLIDYIRDGKIAAEKLGWPLKHK